MATRARQILRADALHERGYRGTGEVVGICDTGLDTGSLDSLHPALRGKVLTLLAYGRRTADDPDGHGTHVAGCLVGDAQTERNGRMTGTATGAHLVVQSVFYSDSDPFANLPSTGRMLEDAYDEGVRIHSNSWIRILEKNGYSVTAEELDRFVWQHRDMLVVTAAGNQGRYEDAAEPPAHGTLCVPATAKNSLAVGATENLYEEYGKPYRSFFPKDLRRCLPPTIADEIWSVDADRIAAYSGCGWATDRRIKPDVVAPGTVVLSVRSSQIRRRQVRRWHEQWGDPGEDAFILMGGTSASAPLVAGCAALVREYLRRRTGAGMSSQSIANPSAALVKAVLINGARYVREDRGGTFVRPSAPTLAQGWGLVDLDASLPDDEASPLCLYAQDEARGLRTGEVAAVRFAITADGHPFRATLSWTDAPGERLVADLDLTVEAAGRRRNGNQEANTTGFDRENNVERVVWDGMPRGEVIVTVRAHRAERPQPFALAVTGAFSD